MKSIQVLLLVALTIISFLVMLNSYLHPVLWKKITSTLGFILFLILMVTYIKRRSFTKEIN